MSETVLKLHSFDHIYEFEKKYATKNKQKIKWHKVAKHYDGISICHKLVGKDDYFSWLYDWSCSSGCIWHKNGATDLRVVKTWKKTWTENV